MPKSKAKIYKAKQILKQKIGSGPIEPELIEQAQRVIEENDVEFAPLGLQFLNELDRTLKDVEENLAKEKFNSQKKALTQPVMDMKANAKMFHYDLVGTLANIMLNFLETINSLDKNALAIVSGHHDTLHEIIKNNMRGDSAEKGQIFITELEKACSIYHNNKKKSQD